MRILIAEDDPAMGKILLLYFGREGFDTVLVTDGTAALERLTEEYFDLAVLDWMMPAPDGPAVCRELRKLRVPVKVLMLTAKGQNEDELKGLLSGADDYLRKPFEPQILMLRAKKLLHADHLLTCGTLTLNRQTLKADLDGHSLSLSRKEHELLEYFLCNQGMVLTRELLLDRVWGLDYDGDERTVDTHVKRLRAKIGEGWISTHRGLGYCMEKRR